MRNTNTFPPDKPTWHIPTPQPTTTHLRLYRPHRPHKKPNKRKNLRSPLSPIPHTPKPLPHPHPHLPGTKPHIQPLPSSTSATRFTL
eukprot:4638390-Ditylum_brightwellii.AAC.1